MSEVTNAPTIDKLEFSNGEPVSELKLALSSRAELIRYISNNSVQQVENLIKNLMTVSDLLISSNFERHAAIEDLISMLDQSLDQRFELVC